MTTAVTLTVPLFLLLPAPYAENDATLPSLRPQRDKTGGCARDDTETPEDTRGGTTCTLS